MKRPRPLTLGLWVAGIAALVALFPVSVCRDTAEVDCHSGSRRGYTRWAWGGRTFEWHKPSDIEVFMRQKYPAEFQQRWVSYQGDEHNIFGVLLTRVHGSPGPVLWLHPTVINEYCRSATDAEKRRIYDLLAAGDRAKIDHLIEEIRLRLITDTAKPAASVPLRWHPLVHSIEDYRRMQPGRTLVILFSNEWETSGPVLKKVLMDSRRFQEAVDSDGALLLVADFTRPESVGHRELVSRGRIPVVSMLVLRRDDEPHWIESTAVASIEEFRREYEDAVVALLTPALAPTTALSGDSETPKP